MDGKEEVWEWVTAFECLGRGLTDLEAEEDTAIYPDDNPDCILTGPMIEHMDRGGVVILAAPVAGMRRAILKPMQADRADDFLSKLLGE